MSLPHATDIHHLASHASAPTSREATARLEIPGFLVRHDQDRREWSATWTERLTPAEVDSVAVPGAAETYTITFRDVGQDGWTFTITAVSRDALEAACMVWRRRAHAYAVDLR